MTSILPAPLATKDDLIAAIDEIVELQEKKTAILDQAIPALWFTLAATTDPAALPLGGSRIGGDPDLPQGYEWPCNDSGEPLAFLFQLDLSPLNRGFIAVFCGNDEPANNMQHHVVFADTDTPLVRTPALPTTLRPEFDDFDDTENYSGYFATPKALIPHLGLDIPRWYSTPYQLLIEDDDDLGEVYEDLNADVPYAIIRAGGHLAGIGIDPAEDACEAHAMAETKTTEWQHLVTLNSEDELLIWDAGYFQILTHEEANNRKTYAGVESS